MTILEGHDLEGHDTVSDSHPATTHLQLILHNDDDTPEEFVIELLHSVFKKPLTAAIKFAATVDRFGEAVCGIYPRGMADDLLKAARERIRQRVIGS